MKTLSTHPKIPLERKPHFQIRNQMAIRWGMLPCASTQVDSTINSPILRHPRAVREHCSVPRHLLLLYLHDIISASAC
jgi:hypothetical protein